MQRNGDGLVIVDADTDKDVGFSGLTYSERNGAYFAVSGLHGTLWRIDPLLRQQCPSLLHLDFDHYKPAITKRRNVS